MTTYCLLRLAMVYACQGKGRKGGGKRRAVGSGAERRVRTVGGRAVKIRVRVGGVAERGTTEGITRCFEAAT